MLKIWGPLMNVLFDQERLLQLLTNLYVFTGIAANILDPQGRDIDLFEGHPPFCKAMNALPEGHRRCVECDAWKVKSYHLNKGSSSTAATPGSVRR